MDGKLEGENATILGLQVLEYSARRFARYKYIAQLYLYEWCPHDGNALFLRRQK